MRAPRASPARPACPTCLPDLPDLHLPGVTRSGTPGVGRVHGAQPCDGFKAPAYLRDSMEGEPVPAFTMKDQDGKEVSNESLKGSAYVLYFYPKDDTPGCTKEACGIRDAWSDFGGAGLKVFGVSKDDEASHQKFIDKYDLPFPLLVATEADLEAFGVWKEKNMYGRKYMGINRETFLVGADGIVLKHYAKVKPAEHAAELLSDFQELTA